IITLTSLGGFNGTVNLSDLVSGCACGLQTSLGSSQVTLGSGGSATVTLSISTGTKTGNDVVTITGASTTSPPFSASTTVTVIVINFNLIATTTSLMLYPASANSTVINITSIIVCSGNVV